MYRATCGRGKSAGKGPCDLDHQTASQSRSEAACRPNAPKSPQNWGARWAFEGTGKGICVRNCSPVRTRDWPGSTRLAGAAHAVEPWVEPFGLRKGQPWDWSKVGTRSTNVQFPKVYHYDSQIYHYVCVPDECDERVQRCNHTFIKSISSDFTVIRSLLLESHQCLSVSLCLLEATSLSLTHGWEHGRKPPSLPSPPQPGWVS